MGISSLSGCVPFSALPYNSAYSGPVLVTVCNAVCNACGLAAPSEIVIYGCSMNRQYPTREAAKKLGRTLITLQRYIAAGTTDPPPLVVVGGPSMRLWSERDIEKARRVLSGIKPGRKKKK